MFESSSVLKQPLMDVETSVTNFYLFFVLTFKLVSELIVFHVVCINLFVLVCQEKPPIILMLTNFF